jgi:MFS family permease
MKKILQNRNFFLLWMGQSISSLGTWINFVALNAYIYHVTHSGTIMGIFLLIRLLPSLFFGSLGGILADRFDKRKIMLICDSLRAVIVLAFLFTTRISDFFVLGFLLSALDKIFGASMGAIIPDLVKKEEILEANSLNRMSSSLVTVMGPAVAGALIGFLGYKVAFIIDSASFLWSVLSLILIRMPALPEETSSGTPASLSGEMKEAAGFLAGSTLLLSFLFLRCLDGLGSGTYNTALPVHAETAKIGASFYGYLIACWGGGTFLGSLLTGRFKKMVSSTHLFCASMVLMALGMGGTFHAPLWLLGLLSIFIGGIGDGISSVLFSTLLMESPPRHLRGKIYGTVSAFLYMVVGAGMFLAGLSIDRMKYVHITDAGSLLIIVGTLIVWGLRGKEK